MHKTQPLDQFELVILVLFPFEFPKNFESNENVE